MSPTSPRRAAPAKKVHRDSHLIHKPSSSSSPPSSSSTTNSSVSSSSPGPGNQQQPRPPPRPKQHHPPPQQQQPVIIYTHSPKVIRTSPRDFMSIVQKLTGLDSASANASPAASAATQDDQHSSSSSSSTDSCGANGSGSGSAAPHYVAADPQQQQQLMMPPPPAPAMDHAAHLIMPPDIVPPLFAPGAGLYGGHFPMVDAGPPFSPAMVEAMRTTFPDYQLT
ncbi:VQ motif-containing protein 8, chloroplastic [Brachypodium distachyon]|uniref:VQ domain-containing protein n=1 Tax=Brachypodium distachyon TaxID=15368 RepID=I1I6I3_BRADI|nr:VQ motif-containing protein 8, chloroplastic [Brachypodium distachyon]KQJ97977.1 hypothetical protein BRADI_3g34440v3 [Brachypodium distachyon]|eukprot:XP_024317917.1 VQ motif-containing protein 8, chloroplastic [Brachypodium distachyon]